MITIITYWGQKQGQWTITNREKTCLSCRGDLKILIYSWINWLLLIIKPGKPRSSCQSETQVTKWQIKVRFRFHIAQETEWTNHRSRNVMGRISGCRRSIPTSYIIFSLAWDLEGETSDSCRLWAGLKGGGVEGEVEVLIYCVQGIQPRGIHQEPVVPVQLLQIC